MENRKEKESLFEKISFLNQTDEQKTKIAESIIEENNGDSLYWIEIILSILIATFGLLQNSVAVIIGAMLIAPLLRPMQGMSFSIATGQSGFFWKASFFLLKSVFLSIFLAFLFALLIPLKTETAEILGRITPNILDLFIAIFSAVIAFLSFGYKRLSASVAGVAMAASLMPPLAVVGIELALGNFFSAWGSFLLFFINFLAILLVGVLIFFAYGFTPHQELQKKISIQKFFTLIVIIIFTSFPLYSSLSNISLQIETEKKAQEFLSKTIPLKIPNSTLTDLDVISVDDEKIHLKGVLQVPENIEIFETTYNSILQESENFLGKSLEFDFEMIRTANFKSIDITQKEKEKIIQKIKQLHNAIFSSFSALQISLTHKNENDWEINYILSIPENEYLTDEMKEEFESLLSKDFENDTFTFVWVPISGSKTKQKIITKELTQEELIQADIAKNIEELLSRPEMKGVIIEDITVAVSETDEISFHARVLYKQEKLIKEKKSKEEVSSLSDIYSLFNEKDIANEANAENKKLPEITPFSLEEAVELFEKTPKSLIQKISNNFKSLPYSQIEIDLTFIPYHQENTIFKKDEK